MTSENSILNKQSHADLWDVPPRTLRIASISFVNLLSLVIRRSENPPRKPEAVQDKALTQKEILDIVLFSDQLNF